jgi:putative hydrolase of the HAD superfamily
VALRDFHQAVHNGPAFPAASQEQKDVTQPRIPVRGILLDWGGTLADWVFPGTADEFFLQCYQEMRHLLVRHGYKITLEDLSSIAQSINAGYQELRERGLVELPQRFLNRCLLWSLGILRDDLLAAVDEIMTRRKTENTQLFGQAAETLRGLRSRQLRIGILSNATNPLIIRRIICQAQLAALIDVVVVSADVGICKPAPGIFTYALEQLGTQPNETWMVGNDLYADIHGAASIGLTSVHVATRSENANHPLAGTPTYAVAELREVPALLDTADKR